MIGTATEKYREPRRKSVWHDVTPQFWTFFAPVLLLGTVGHRWLKFKLRRLRTFFWFQIL